MCLEEVQSVQSIRYIVGKEKVLPLHVGSAGKMLLSELDEPELDLLLATLHLQRVGPNSITEKETLRKEVNKVRKSGYAISFSERDPGCSSVAVPISNYVCPVVLALLGPEHRLTLPVMMGTLKEMKQAAQSISRKLGAVFCRASAK
jgi:DNA-binding IclR family transcriptional regulator